MPYRVQNEVVEFEEDRKIAWRHLGHHVWRYELEPVAEGTRVTETFEWAHARAPWALELLRVPQRNRKAMSIQKLTQIAKDLNVAGATGMAPCPPPARTDLGRARRRRPRTSRRIRIHSS